MDFGVRAVVYLQTERKVVPGAIHQHCRADVKVADVGRFVEVSIGAVAVATPNFLLALIMMFLAKKFFGTSKIKF